MERHQALHFNSLEELSAAPHGWDVQINPLLSAANGASMEIAASQNILMNLVRLGDPTLQRGSTPENMRTFSLIRQQTHDHTFRGHAIDRNTLIVFPRDRELHAVSSGSIEMMNFSVAEDLLQGAAERLEISLNTLDQLPAAVSFGDRERAVLLRQLEVLAEYVVKYGDHSTAAELSRGLEEDLICALLLSLIDISRDCSKASANKRYRTTRTAIDYILAHPRQPIKAGELAEQASTTRRTLEKGFAEMLGMSPQQFIKSRRLHGCREELQSQGALPRPQITAIAGKWGFWHMGQFAADYRRLFGELPSQTIQR